MKAKELNGYYYCFSFDEWSHDLYSITEMSRKEAILTAIDNGVRLYLVKYRKGKQQGKEFKQMLDGLVDQEEKHLQVNSEEFKRRHRELVELIRKAERGEDNGRKA